MTQPSDAGMSGGFVSTASMTNVKLSLESLDSADLLSATRELVRKSHCVEADLLAHLGEIDERKLYLDCAHPSMFAFCLDELGFSECAAYNRITVARIGRRLPAVIEAVRSGKVHLAGLRVLAPHLTTENHEVLLAQAARKSKREIEEMVARLWPLPPVPTSIRRLPECPVVKSAPVPLSRALWSSADPPLLPDEPRSASSSAREPREPAAPLRDQRPIIAPLSGETFRIQFTATREVRDKLQEAQNLLRHSVPDGDLSTIIGRALDLLIEDVKKKRFAIGRKARSGSTESGKTRESGETPRGGEEPRMADESESAKKPQMTESADGSGELPAGEEPCPAEAPTEVASRHIPDAIKRAVYERDGGRCAFMDDQGRRCTATGAVEFDHIDGFARTWTHSVEGIRLLCRAHNQHAADQMYGREFMEQARAGNEAPSTPPGESWSASRAQLAPGRVADVESV